MLVHKFSRFFLVNEIPDKIVASHSVMVFSHLPYTPASAMPGKKVLTFNRLNH